MAPKTRASQARKKPNTKSKAEVVKTEATALEKPAAATLPTPSATSKPTSRETTSDTDQKIILDEIALEGLSGVTLNRLLRLLETQGTLKKTTLNNVWLVLIEKYLRYPHGVNVQAFHVKTRCRGKGQNDQVKTQSSDKRVFYDKPIKLPNQTVGRYAVGSARFLYPVQDGFVMGSCDSYHNRVNITRDLLTKADMDGTPESLKFLKSKYGLDNVFFVASQHIRAKALLPSWTDPNIDIKLREYCVLEMIGKSRHTGIVFPNDKTFGRYRIMLMGKGLITQFQENNTSPIQHHLRRFSHSKCKVELLPKRLESLDSDDEDDDDPEQLPLSQICYDPNKMKVDRGILANVYDVIAQSRSGITHLDIRRQLNMPKFHLRNHLKNLISLKLIYSIPPKDPTSTFRLYKTTLKSVKRKKSRKQEELAKPMGIMARWDEVDLRAKQIIGQKRSSFSQAEDSLLILCRITSILIEPGIKLSWCVNKRLVRDLLHKELIEAHDKTSDACLRRIKYLKQLPNNIMSISELTAELRDDPDIKRLILTRDKSVESEEKLNKLFVQVLKRVRAKTPTLLGIATRTNYHPNQQANNGITISLQPQSLTPIPIRTTTTMPTTRVFNRPAAIDYHQQHQRSSLAELSMAATNNDAAILLASGEIRDYNELRSKFELIDCQSVASISMTPTYERPKNLVDVKYNNACLVTMAYVLASNFEQAENLEAKRRSNQWLLDKFYSNFPDKLVSSVLSKLKKQTLLTRKGSGNSSSGQHDQAPVYRAKTRFGLKLNQSVQFLMNRYHSSSLIQLAQPISQLNAQGANSAEFDLSESNEMGPFAMLTSLCSMSSFQMDMELSIPDNVVGIDQGNENFRNLSARANPNTKEILARFLTRCGASGKGESDGANPASRPVLAASTSRQSLSLSEPEARQPDGAQPSALDPPGGIATSSGAEAATVTNAAGGTCSDQVSASQEPVFATLEPVRCAEPMEVDCPAMNDTNDNAVADQQQQEPTMRELICKMNSTTSKMDDSRRALFLLRHELKTQALDKCGSLADCLIVQPCNIKFHSQRALNEFVTDSSSRTTMDSFEFFLKQAQPSVLMDHDGKEAQEVIESPPTLRQRGQHLPEWLIECFSFPNVANDKELLTEACASGASLDDDCSDQFERQKVRVKYLARLWKWLDGSVHLPTLLKLIESLLAWIIVSPGIERQLLTREFGHLLPDEHLFELLDLMESLQLVTSQQLEAPRSRPRLFGYSPLTVNNEASCSGQVVYEPTSGAYVRFCQFLERCNAYCCKS